jgi:hypothetical protein
MQQILKAPARAAGTQVVASELFDQHLVCADDSKTTLDFGFGGISFAAFTAPLERRKFGFDFSLPYRFPLKWNDPIVATIEMGLNSIV